MMNEGKQKWHFHHIRWLVYAVIVTALVSTTTLSRYMTTVSGTGTATVAGFVMEGALSQQNTTIDVSGMKPGDVKQTTFTVANSKGNKISDVTQGYSISVTSTNNLPLSFALTTSDTSGTNHALTENSGLWSGGILPHTTAATHSYILTVTWPKDKNDPKYSYEVDAVTLTVSSQQIN